MWSFTTPTILWIMERGPVGMGIKKSQKKPRTKRQGIASRKKITIPQHSNACHSINFIEKH